MEKSLVYLAGGRWRKVNGAKREDIKSYCEEYGYEITKLLNLVLENRKITTTWKRTIIQWNPNKNIRRNYFSILLGIYNHGHNVLRFFDTLPNCLVTTSETKLDY